MIVILSPAKSLDLSPVETETFTLPRLLEKSEELVGTLKKKSPKKLRELMHVSEKIADLNFDRYQSFQLPFDIENAKPSMYAFNGDVYTGLDAASFEGDEIAFAQKHIRILSGLYGVLRPLDLMQPYRLEMGTKLKHKRKKNLYEFWDKSITEILNEDLAESGNDILLNLASNEYFKAIKPAFLNGKIVKVDFKENRNGVLKVISFNAKKARGRMANLIVTEGINEPAGLKDLNVNGYVFDEKGSDENGYLFVK
ncbi:MAG TPA: peroxide stress protein YaaA [Bacteroidetes bacterium]|nr:peroxide stress protein YaaA [Bacteroidota bacterium]